MQVISKNEERNMQEVVENGQTRHIKIDTNKPFRPKTGSHNPKGGRNK